MEYIWSPWRMEYIQSEKNKDGCVFCAALTLNDGVENLIIHRGEYAYIILNRYPYTSGHVMVVPYQHCATLETLEGDVLGEMISLTARCLKILREDYYAAGFNVGVNIGEAAGAGILDHVHMHIVPRWCGDTNFMSTLGATRVIPETLEDSYRKIKTAWDQLKAG